MKLPSKSQFIIPNIYFYHYFESMHCFNPKHMHYISNQLFFLTAKDRKDYLGKRTKRMDNRGIDPLTYRMRSDRSTIWANYPMKLSLVLATIRQIQISNHEILTLLVIYSLQSNHLLPIITTRYLEYDVVGYYQAKTKMIKY